MKCTFALSLLVSSATAVSFTQTRFTANSSCKTILGDESWPSKSQWRAAMPEIETQRSKGNWKRPPYRLDATTVAEVVAAVNFTRQHNIRISILASGHDFVGRNDAPTGLTLSVSGLKGARVSGSFKATREGVERVESKMMMNVLGKQEGQAYVTFGAGYNTRELNSLLAASGLFTLGAAHGSVAVAGGWGQTAGHAPFSAQYGLGVDQVVELKVVTADGFLRVANEVSNPDLFWALRGGGGGTFGIVVEATIKAHPSQKVASAQFWINTTSFTDNTSIYPFAAKFHSEFTAWQEKGMGAYYWLYPNAMSIFMFYSGPDASSAWMNINMRPLFRNLSTTEGINPKTMLLLPSEFPDFWSFFKATWGDMPETMPSPSASTPPPPSSLWKRHGPKDGAVTEPRGIVYLDSWLLSKSHLESPNFAAALKASMPNLPNGNLGGQFIGGGKVISNGINETTSILPAWRKTSLHLIHYAYGKPSSLPLRKFAPDMGAYANEAYPATHANWKKTYWGLSYPRLLAIKREYDPMGVFWVTPGIGADEWSAQADGRICRRAGDGIEDGEGAYSPANDNKNDGDVHLIDEIAGPAFPIQFGRGFGGG